MKNKRIAVLLVKEHHDFTWIGAGEIYFCSLRDKFEIPKAHTKGALVINSQPHPQGYKLMWDEDWREWRYFQSIVAGRFFVSADQWLDSVLGRDNVGYITFES